jgi:hypothetical protein
MSIQRNVVLEEERSSVRDIELEDEPGPNLEGKAETLKSKPNID